MLLILEGADGVGKTTLAERWAEQLGWERTTVLHRGPLKNHPLDEYEQALDFYVPGFGWHVICDRWHLGEDVYGPYLRGESKLDLASRWHIEAYLQSRGAVLVHVQAPADEIKRRLRERGDTLVDPADVPWLVHQYKHIIVRSVLQSVPGHRALAVADDVEGRVRALARFRTYVGSRRPDYLLLGETRADSNYAAAFVPFPATSGAYLLRALARLPYERTAYGIANALEEDVPALHRALGEPNIVTLGAKSHEAVASYGIAHGRVPHPQWVRRFKHDHKDTYALMIMNALQGADRHEWPDE